MEVARRFFSTKGYHGTTIRDISEASGILSGSLYAHINSKEDLLFEITDRGAEAFLGSLRPIVEGPGSPREKLRRGLTAHARVVADNLEGATVFFHEWKSLSKERREIIQRKRDEYESLWARIIDEGIEKGEFSRTRSQICPPADPFGGQLDVPVVPAGGALDPGGDRRSLRGDRSVGHCCP